MLTEFPPLIKHFADTRDLFADAVTALGRVSKATDDALSQANPDIHANLQNLQRPLIQLGKASPYLIGALKVLLTAPFSIENVPKVVRGDYINVSLNVDLTLSAIDNGLLTGTGCLGHAAGTRAGVGSRSRHDDPGRPVHAEPARRARVDRWSREVSELC